MGQIKIPCHCFWKSLSSMNTILLGCGVLRWWRRLQTVWFTYLLNYLLAKTLRSQMLQTWEARQWCSASFSYWFKETLALYAPLQNWILRQAPGSRQFRRGPVKTLDSPFVEDIRTLTQDKILKAHTLVHTPTHTLRYSSWRRCCTSGIGDSWHGGMILLRRCGGL